MGAALGASLPAAAEAEGARSPRGRSWDIAKAYIDQRDLPRAMGACKKLGRLPGAEADGHACVADAYLVWQRATEALAETAVALAKDPRCYEAKMAEGRAYELSLEPAEAEAAFRDAIALAPDADPSQGADARVGLGRVLLLRGERDEGLTQLRQAVRLDPDGPDALFELGTALAPSPESVTLLEHATRERPFFAKAWLSLGTQQLAAGHLAEARTAVDAARQGESDPVAALVLAGQIALAQHRPDDAITAGTAALKVLANSAAATLVVAGGHAMKGDLDLALEAYQSAWGLDHQDPAPLVLASVACHKAARDTSARAFGAKATEEFPNFAPGWVALGDALVSQREVAGARDAYRKALSVPDGTIDRGAVQGKLSALQ